MNYDPIRVLYTGLRKPDAPDALELYHFPALQFRTLSLPISDIVHAIEESDAVCVYSARAIDAIKSEPKIIGALLDHKPSVVCVGSRTSETWQAEIDPRCEPIECRTFAELVAHIRLSEEHERITAFELQDGPRSMSRESVPQLVKAYDVYATSRKNPSLKEWNQVRGFDPQWVAFTSPRGVKALGDRIHELSPIKVASIGGTTTDAIVRAGFSVDAIAKSSRAEILLDAILREGV